MLASVKTSAKGSPSLRAKRARTISRLVIEPPSVILSCDCLSWVRVAALALDLAVVPTDAARPHCVPAVVKMFEEGAAELETSSLEQLSRPARVDAGTAWHAPVRAGARMAGKRACRGHRTSIQLIACQTPRKRTKLGDS